MPVLDVSWLYIVRILGLCMKKYCISTVLQSIQVQTYHSYQWIQIIFSRASYANTTCLITLHFRAWIYCAVAVMRSWSTATAPAFTKRYTKRVAKLQQPLSWEKFAKVQMQCQHFSFGNVLVNSGLHLLLQHKIVYTGTIFFYNVY